MKLSKFSLLPFFLITLISCHKAGPGGDNTIVAFPHHHSKPIPNTVIYIKYGTNTFPGEDVSKYNDHKVAVAEPGEEPHAHFEGLRKGKYFLYGVGYDSSISQIVTGGTPTEIKTKSGESDINVPVTEK
jgi:hypothetical protein